MPSGSSKCVGAAAAIQSCGPAAHLPPPPVCQTVSPTGTVACMLHDDAWVRCMSVGQEAQVLSGRVRAMPRWASGVEDEDVKILVNDVVSRTDWLVYTEDMKVTQPQPQRLEGLGALFRGLYNLHGGSLTPNRQQLTRALVACAEDRPSWFTEDHAAGGLTGGGPPGDNISMHSGGGGGLCLPALAGPHAQEEERVTWAKQMAARLLVACKHVRTALETQRPPEWAVKLWEEGGGESEDQAEEGAGVRPGHRWPYQTRLRHPQAAAGPPGQKRRRGKQAERLRPRPPPPAPACAAPPRPVSPRSLAPARSTTHGQCATGQPAAPSLAEPAEPAEPPRRSPPGRPAHCPLQPRRRPRPALCRRRRDSRPRLGRGQQRSSRGGGPRARRRSGLRRGSPSPRPRARR